MRYQLFSDCLVQRMALCAPVASSLGDLERGGEQDVVVDTERHQPDAFGFLARGGRDR